MKRFRFNIASLLGIILVLGIGFAALKVASDLWESGVFTLTLGALPISVLLAYHRLGSRRAFWIGFALFGWVYMALALIPSIEPRLITTKILAYLDSKMPGRLIESFDDPDFYPETTIGNTPTSNVTRGGIQSVTVEQTPAGTVAVTSGKLISNWSYISDNFVRIGHSVFALLFGWLGGQLSNRLCRTSRESEALTLVESGGDPM
jgi:hypothetical protein